MDIKTKTNTDSVSVVVPGPRSEERAGASSGPAAVWIPGGDAVPAETNRRIQLIA